MLVTRTTYGAQGVCSFVLSAKRFAPILLTLLMLISASAADFNITQISSDDIVSREPVISETGLAAWGAYITTVGGQLAADIMIYSNGTTRPLFRTRLKDNAANIRPYVHSNTIAWVGVMPGTARNVSWQLRQVPSPDRDEGAPELEATPLLRLTESGEQIWLPPPTNGVPVEEPATAPTNGVPASADTETTVPEVATSDTNEVAETEPPPPASEPAVVKPAPDTSTLEDPARRLTSGDTEVMLWRGGADVYQLTADNRDNLGPTAWGDLVAWQTAKGWPFGWEIMVWADGQVIQLTTNYYYDLAPKVHGPQVVWHGWDGHDFEIFLYDHTRGATIQITSNQYDDLSPALWNGVVVWEGYAGANADIFIWENGRTRKLSSNIEDDLNPRIWNGQVVWQGFDGDDFEIYHYDGSSTNKLTSNTYDDVNPDIRDGIICWMGYHDNWDAEIFAWDGGPDAIRLTDNEYEDRNPRTAGGRIIWETEQGGKSIIFLAEPGR